jgi:uncharacterized protein YdbL (DUF1318 family)
MRHVLSFKVLLLTVGLLAACVTVNVYFPAAAAQEAADAGIGYIKGESTAPQPRADEARREPATSSLTPSQPAMLLFAGRVLELLVPAAHAQANIDISTPEVRAILQSMKERFTELRKYFQSGAVGLTADGLIAVRDQSAVPLAERATVTRLVADDNRDRAALYAAIAKANGHPEWEAEIRRTWAQRWVERGAEPGWYYQNSSGAWVQK